MTEAVIEGQAPLSVLVADNEIKLPALLEKEVIKADQDKIRTSLLSIDLLIHQNMVQCAMHAEKHGDTSLFRRLLMDIIDPTTGYRRQGVIVWMRTFTPMELVGDVIKLTGLMPDGETKRPWKLEEGNRQAFTKLSAAREQVAKPIYRDTLMSKVNLAMKEWRNAKANTTTDAGGKNIPIDKTKPFYDGIYMDAMSAVFEDIEKALVPLETKPDSTLAARKAHEAAAKANAEAASYNEIKEVKTA